MTAWDRRVFGATVALGALLVVVACVVGGATDEGAVTWATRALRVLPIVPVCGAAVTFLALRRASLRGEMLALESIGCSPARAALFVVVAASALSVAAGAIAFVRHDAVDAFFPRASAHADVRVHGDEFVDDARGVRIERDGTITSDATSTNPDAPAAPGRALAASAVLVALGVALPLVAARSSKRADLRALAATAAMCVFCIFLFQASAANRAPAILAIFPAAALLVFAIVRYRAPAW